MIATVSGGTAEGYQARGIKARLLNPYDAYWDWKLGINTFCYHPASNERESDWKVHYPPTPYRDIFDLLRVVKLNGDDVFVDLGSGLGRAVFAAGWVGCSAAD